jgi:uncharacterized membrane protein
MNMIFAFQQFTCAAALLWLPPRAFWPWFAGGVILVIGLLMFVRIRPRQAGASGTLIALGPLLFAIPLAVFGGDHFISANFVAQIVPHWIPWHLFWTYFVGTALIAAALSLATNIQSRLAAFLLGIMILIFVLTMHLPACFAMPHDKIRWTIFLRDSSLSLSALAFAASWSNPDRVRRHGHLALEPRPGSRTDRVVVTVARFAIATVIAVFGFTHFLYPNAAPGIPQENGTFVITMPHWIPAHALWSYITGAIFVVCAARIASGKRARLAATILGATVLALVVIVYFPIALAKPSDIGTGLNYLAIHFALAGAAFFLAGALPQPLREEVTAPERPEPSLGRVSDS